MRKNIIVRIMICFQIIIMMFRSSESSKIERKGRELGGKEAGGGGKGDNENSHHTITLLRFLFIVMMMGIHMNVTGQSSLQ